MKTSRNRLWALLPFVLVACQGLDTEADIASSQEQAPGGPTQTMQAASPDPQIVDLARAWLEGSPNQRDTLAPELHAQTENIDEIINAVWPAPTHTQTGDVTHNYISLPHLKDAYAGHSYQMFVPHHYSGEKPFGIFIFLTWGGSYPGPSEVDYLAEWTLDPSGNRSLIRPEVDTSDYIAVAPQPPHDQLLHPLDPGTAARWNVPTVEAYLMAVVNDIAQKYNIDYTRIVLSGHSMGAIGTIYGLHQLSDWWSGVLASGFNWELGSWDSLHNTPIMLVQGRHDAYFNAPGLGSCREHRTAVEYAQFANERLKASGHPNVRYCEYDGYHALNEEGEACYRQFINGQQGWVTGMRRDPYVKKAYAVNPWRTWHEKWVGGAGGEYWEELPSPHTEWISINEIGPGTIMYDYARTEGENSCDSYERWNSWQFYKDTMDLPGGKATAEIVSGNRVIVTQENVRQLSLWMHPRMLNIQEPIHVEINGQGRNYPCAPSLLKAVESYERRWNRSKIFHCEIAINVNTHSYGPVAIIQADVTSGKAPLTVTFSAEKSEDPQGDIDQWQWTLEGRILGNESTLTHTFEKEGTYEVTLKVTDATDAYATDSIVIRVGDIPEDVVGSSGKRTVNVRGGCHSGDPSVAMLWVILASLAWALFRRGPRSRAPSALVVAVLVFGSTLGHAKTYYASPTGGGDGHSEAGPFQIADFWSVAKAGDTLILLDGTYTGDNSMITPPAGLAGQSGAPITLKAMNDGQVNIDGERQRTPVELYDNHWFVLEGFNVHSAGGEYWSQNVFTFKKSNDNIARRLVGWDARGDANVFRSTDSKRNLFEDCAAFGEARKLFSTSQGGNDTTFRRCYARWNYSRNKGPKEAFSLSYNSYNTLCENCIATLDNELEATYTLLESDGTPQETYSNHEVQAPQGIFSNDDFDVDNDHYTTDVANIRVVGSIAYIKKGVRYTNSLREWAGPLSLWLKGVTLEHSIAVVEPGSDDTIRSLNLEGGEVGKNAAKFVTAIGRREPRITSNWSQESLYTSESCEGLTQNGGHILDPSLSGVTSGATVMRRYEKGVLQSEALWPWPMNDRIIQAMMASGRQPVDVTREVFELCGGSVPKEFDLPPLPESPDPTVPGSDPSDPWAGHEEGSKKSISAVGCQTQASGAMLLLIGIPTLTFGLGLRRRETRKPKHDVR